MGAAESRFLQAASEGDTQAAIDQLKKEGKRLLKSRDNVRKPFFVKAPRNRVVS
jgi:hypothetical protein